MKGIIAILAKKAAAKKGGGEHYESPDEETEAKPEGDEDEMQMAKESAMTDLIDAIHAKRSAEAVAAFKELYDLCASHE